MNFTLVDTTLRDGEQTAGVVFANQEKLNIARMLDEVGVEQIEAGIPVMGGDEKDIIRKIVKSNLRASIMGWNRAVISDIEQSIDCGVDAVAISISTSDIHIKDKLKSTREQVLSQMVSAVEYAKKEGMYISVNAEDASRTDEDFLFTFISEAINAGANRIRYCDTIGILNPIQTYTNIKNIKDRFNIDVEMHTHNDLGMASANAIAGVMAGATHVGVTVNGLGERAGNASLEEIIMAAKCSLNLDNKYNLISLKPLCEYVSVASGRKLSPWKAVVGDNIFSHESGIHADGAIKNPKTYELYSPDDIGLTRKLIVGKHSGTAGIKNKLLQLGIHMEDEMGPDMLQKVRAHSIELKRSLNDMELLRIYADLKNNFSFSLADAL
ncbi:MAG: homocitrate synthase [Proteocatella sp.]